MSNKKSTHTHICTEFKMDLALIKNWTTRSESTQNPKPPPISLETVADNASLGHDSVASVQKKHVQRDLKTKWTAPKIYPLLLAKLDQSSMLKM